MSAGKANLILEKGATFFRTFRWKDSNGYPIDLTGYEVEMFITDKPGGDIIIEPSISVDPPNGSFAIEIDATTTANLDAFRLEYEITLTSPSNFVTRLVEGDILVRSSAEHG